MHFNSRKIAAAACRFHMSNGLQFYHRGKSFSKCQNFCPHPSGRLSACHSPEIRLPFEKFAHSLENFCTIQTFWKIAYHHMRVHCVFTTTIGIFQIAKINSPMVLYNDLGPFAIYGSSSYPKIWPI